MLRGPHLQLAQLAVRGARRVMSLGGVLRRGTCDGLDAVFKGGGHIMVVMMEEDEEQAGSVDGEEKKIVLVADGASGMADLAISISWVKMYQLMGQDGEICTP